METQSISTASEINNLVKKLNKEQQKELLKNLKKQIVLDMAKKLQGSVKPNKLTMDEIVEEVRIVRKLRYDAEKSHS